MIAGDWRPFVYGGIGSVTAEFGKASRHQKQNTCHSVLRSGPTVTAITKTIVNDHDAKRTPSIRRIAPRRLHTTLIYMVRTKILTKIGTPPI